MDICFCFGFNIARDVVTGLLIFVDIYHLDDTFSRAHVEARTHKHTCGISAQEKWRGPGIGAWLGREDSLLKKDFC